MNHPEPAVPMKPQDLTPKMRREHLTRDAKIWRALGRRRIRGALTLLLVIPFLAMGATVAAQTFSIGDYKVTDQGRYGRTQFSYRLSARLFNQSCNSFPHVWAFLRPPADPNIHVDIESPNGTGYIDFTDVPAGGSVSSDSRIVIVVDRALTVDDSILQWDVFPQGITGITIASPANGSHTYASEVSVEGEISDPASLVTVNGVQAPLFGLQFRKSIPLIPGFNEIKASVGGASCAPGAASVVVYKDPTPSDDLSLNLSASSDSVSIGQELTYMLAVQNAGPSPSTGILVSDVLPTDTTYISGETSHGTVTENGGVVSVVLGSLGGGESAEIKLRIRVHGDTIVNHAHVTRNEHEENVENNSMTLTTHVVSYYSFRVNQLETNAMQQKSTSELQPLSPPFITGDLAVGAERIFVSGMSGSGTYDLDSFQFGGRNMGPRGATLSDLRSGSAWQLGFHGTPIRTGSGGIVSQLLPLDGLNGESVHGNILRELVIEGSTVYADRVQRLDSDWDEGFNSELAQGATPRLRALLRAPTDGEYTFWLSGDTGSELWLSTDESPDHRIRIASTTEWTASGGTIDWGAQASQRSAPIFLAKDQLYYVEMRVMGWRLDTHAVGWAKPGESTSEPSELIPASVFERIQSPLLENEPPTVELSRPIEFKGCLGMYSGYGRVVLYDGTEHRAYTVEIPSGIVADLGILPPTAAALCDRGVAENEGDRISLIRVIGHQAIRTRIPDGETTLLSTFPEIEWFSMLSASLKRRKWISTTLDGSYGDYQTVVSADADFSLTPAIPDNDIAVSITPAEFPATISAETSVLITVSNTGPAPATGVRLNGTVEGLVSISSVLVSQGSYQRSGGQLECAFGEIAGGASASVTIRYTPNLLGRVVHSAVVVRDEPDQYFPNNHERCAVTVSLPLVTPARGVSVLEGDTGVTEASVPVSLSRAVSYPITVNYSAFGDPEDMINGVGQLTFAPGETTKDAVVFILGDTRHGPDEAFYLELSSASGARLGDFNSASASVIIRNDDPPPILTVTGLALDEGTDSQVNWAALFELTLSAPSETTISVDYTTTDGTATSAGNEDYVAADGWSVRIPPGQTVGYVPIQIIADSLWEPDETLKVTLFNPVNVTLGNREATGIIRNDDLTLGAANSGSQGLKIEFQSLSGARYRVEVAASVVGEWKPVDHLTGTGGILKWLPAESPTHSCFYRVVQE